MIVNPGTPDIRGERLQGERLETPDVVKHAQRLGHHLRAYVVSGQYGELEGRHGKGVYR